MLCDPRINNLIDRLRTAGASGVDEYKRKLRNNERNSKLLDLLFEGRAALMFLAHGWSVHLRERPDLEMRIDRELLFAEVKHFRPKEQDAVDEAAMQASQTDELVHYGDLRKLEGKDAEEQILDVVIKKSVQCVPGSPNILVVESSSFNLELRASSAAHLIDAACRSGARNVCRFSGILLVNESGWTRLGDPDVEFCPITHADTSLTPTLTRALSALCSR